ncbi:hypothetical protein [Chryseosolibacter indicus]|uniref:Uncharacterized protein n=1 Tax=Chryseosolibacter indicus TaxID=2782351 RepID=A0ABS5VU12_9BACT|nr:hypothetical protein [Chryseosolibacter indicus]MBT1704330.1 hypothetical protein [Chryseosolibacter indicus]
METTIHTYKLKPGLFIAEKELVITPEFIEYKNSNNSSVKIGKSSFKDVKYLGDWIALYRFNLGYNYRIEIKYEDDKVLPISFVGYSNYKKVGTTYTDISKWIGKYFLSDIIHARLSEVSNKGGMQINDLVIKNEGLEWQNTLQLLPWQQVGLQEYHQYFVVFNKSNSNEYRRFSFVEWNSEILFNVLKALAE